MDAPQTLQQAIIYFSDADRAFRYTLNLRRPNGLVICPRCGSEKHSFIKTRRIWHCKGCKKQFTLKFGTIFEDSPLGLDKWMCAYWMLCNSRNGVSSCEVARSLGTTQKSAWLMLHRIRKTLHDDFSIKLSGEVESDETFMGGKARNTHVGKRQRRTTGTGSKDWVAVIGFLQRDGKVVTTVVPNRKKHALQSDVRSMSRLVPRSTRTFSSPTKAWLGRRVVRLVGFVRCSAHVLFAVVRRTKRQISRVEAGLAAKLLPSTHNAENLLECMTIPACEAEDE